MKSSTKDTECRNTVKALCLSGFTTDLVLNTDVPKGQGRITGHWNLKVPWKLLCSMPHFTNEEPDEKL